VFRIWSLGFGVFGFKVWDSSGFRVQVSWLRV